MKLDDHLKKAIAELPEKEKDKLLFRLLRQHPLLADQLYFELVDETSVDGRRDRMEAHVVTMVERATDSYHTPRDLMVDLRHLSGEINEHVKVTRDKYGEVHLNLRMLALALSGNAIRLNSASFGSSAKLCVYVVAKVFNMLVLMQKLHPDLRFDLQKDLRTIGELMGANGSMMRTAIHHGLDVNWLLTGDVPDGIEEMRKELRRRGYLK
jgi:hypothetical protein